MPIDPWLSQSNGDLDPIEIAVFRMAIPSTAPNPNDPGDGSGGGGGGGGTPAPTLQPLPSLRCLVVDAHAGAKVRAARFAYEFGDGNINSPQTFEAALSTAVTLPETVLPGDRLCVRAARPDGQHFWLFDGHAKGFDLIFSEAEEDVHVNGRGVEGTLWDSPMPGALVRNADLPDFAGTPTGPNHCATGSPLLFNPRGLPNCTPDGEDFYPGSDDEIHHPVFLDELVVRTPDVRTLWTLPKAAAYLIYRGNPTQRYVTNPTRVDLGNALVSRIPNDGIRFDPNNPATYTAKPISAPSLPFVGRPFPQTLEGMIGNQGFSMRFPLGDSAGMPQTSLEVLFQQSGPIKDVYLQPRGQTLDLSLTNAAASELTRDLSEAPNRWEVHGTECLYEVTVILQCGFPCSASEIANIAQFNLNSAGFDAVRSKYRDYIFDETGEGHYKPGTATKLTSIPSLDAILGAQGPDGLPTYARRRRPGIGDLLTTDASGSVLKATLSYSTDYAGPAPGIHNGTGTWTPIHGGYSLMRDRLGIRITAENPNAWNIGKGNDGGSKILMAVESQAKPTAANPAFTLKLTCVIRGDQVVKGVADRRPTAIDPETVTRFVDASDRYQKNTIVAGSEHNTGTGATAKVVRDDSDLATAEAVALRDATDAGLLEGPITIPWFTMQYDLLDRIQSINGRGLGLRTDGGGASDTPVLPLVQSIRWVLEGENGPETVLHLSDSVLLRKSYRTDLRGGRAFRRRKR